MKGQQLRALVIYFWSIAGAYSYPWENLDNSVRLLSTGFCQPFEEHSTEESIYSLESEEYEETTSRIGDQIICHQVYLVEMNPIGNCKNCKKLIYQESQILTIKTNKLELNFIEELDMAKTGIQKIEYGAFANLPHLKVLNLEMNHLKKIKTETFNSFRNLILLNLSHNAIEEIEDESFHGSGAISILDLSHNRISVLPDGLFFLLNLTSLNISNNLLVNLGNTFCVSPNLITLRLDNNLLESIPKCLRRSMITDLSVSFNSITDFEGHSLPLTLEAFDISNNNLRRIDVDSFSAYSYLKKVDLSANALETFETNSFKYLHNLKYLTINGMNIKTINSELFTSMETLTELRIAKNNISVIEKGIFLDLSNLELLDLSENNINSIPLELFKNLKYLQMLNISHNNIKYLQSGVFYGLEKLKKLDLSFNNIYALHYHIFEPSNVLNVLDIKFNHIKELKIFEVLAFCGNLKTLSIDGNNFSCIALATVSLELIIRNIYILEKGRTFSTPNIGGVSCHDSEKNYAEPNIGNISDVFGKLANNQKNSDLMTVLIKNQQKNTAESLFQSDEAKRTECLINAIYQLKIFVILCTFIIMLTIFAMKISSRVKNKYSNVNFKEQNYEIPIIS